MQLTHGLVPPVQALTWHRKLTENVSLGKSSLRSLGCPPGSLRNLKRPDLNSNSVCLNLKPSRVNLTHPDPQQTLPFLTLKDKALKSLVILTLGGKNLTQNYRDALTLPLTYNPPTHK
eukprot:736154-Pelagomonas_calceolata.AAC.1